MVSSFRQVQDSLERSENVLKMSNREELKKIHDLGINTVSNQADSIYYASEELNGLIDEFKKQIANLDLSGSDTEVAYDVIATPDMIKGALISATSTLVERSSKVEIAETKKEHVDSLINNMVRVQSHSTYFTTSFKNVPSAGALVTLTKMQLESSEITNITLKSLYGASLKAHTSSMGGDTK
ncbi:hypothetical protein D7004_01245 [Pedobacter jejuensis]|uniref:Flagellin N-terminal domain-containing protein n=2 Tax=Pedobacter jejuensis TaxID=1268550 RepID=A0A3N0C286_9SPHI|nr:hypothetical protein D7004_01245 [Pedobacter jejuensis]